MFLYTERKKEDSLVFLIKSSAKLVLKTIKGQEEVAHSGNVETRRSF